MTKQQAREAALNILTSFGLQVQNVAAIDPALTINAKDKCPECGGDMDEDGECEECGYVENAAQPRHLESQQFLNKSGSSKKQVHGQVQTDYTGTDVDPIDPEEPQDEFANEDLHQDELTGGGEEDDSHEINNEELMTTLNAFPPQAGQAPAAPAAPPAPPPPQHQASKDAAAASLQTEHGKAFGHAKAAMDSSGQGDSPQAAQAHGKAVSQHLKAATQARKSGDEDGAATHDQAAAQHLKAQSMHLAENRRVANTKKLTDDNQPTTNLLEFNMGTLTKRSRKNAVNHLIVNCGCPETDRAALNSLNDKTLLQVLHNAMDDDSDYDDEEDADDGEGKGQFGRNDKGKAEGSNADVQGSGTIQAGGEEDEPDDLNRTAPQLKGGSVKKSPATNKTTFNAWMAQAPKKYQDVFNRLLVQDNHNKQKLVQRLIANVADKAERKELAADLMQKDFPTLQRMLKMLPVANSEPEYEAPPLYLGQLEGLGVTDNADAGDDEQPLGLPIMNWGAKDEAETQVA